MKFKPNSSQLKVIESHSKAPTTRRDFMALGLLGMSAYFMTSLKSPFAKHAWAQTDKMLPKFLTFDLVGGASLSGNWLVGKQGGSKDLLRSYDTLGYNPKSASLDERFGLPAPKNISRMFEGMIAEMSSGAQALFRMGSIAHQSVDDSDVNTHSSLGDIARYWAYKKQLNESGLGLLGTNSGGRTRLNVDSAAFRPQRLSSLEQLDLLSGLPLITKSGVSAAEQEKLVKASTGLTHAQLQELLKTATPEEKKVILEAMGGFNGSTQHIEMDPRTFNEVRSIYDLNQNSRADGESSLIAGIVHSHLRGWVGPSCIALDGFDYHDGSQQTGDTRDERAGREIGRAIELAHQLKTPLFIQILSDGSVTSDVNSRRWVADSGDRGLTLIGYYNPNKTPSQVKTQVGWFTDGQIASLDSFVGANNGNVAKAVLANYLSACKDLGTISKFYTEGEIGTKEIDQSIIFG